jgi:hypothetical protein
LVDFNKKTTFLNALARGLVVHIVSVVGGKGFQVNEKNILFPVALICSKIILILSGRSPLSLTL